MRGKVRSGHRRARRWSYPLAALLFAAAAAAGCEARRQAIDASDRTVLFPAARGVFQAQLDEPDKEGQFQGVAGGELSFDHADGEANSNFGPGDPVELHGVTVPAPVRVALDYNLERYSAAFRGGFWVAHSLGIEGLLGLESHVLSLKASSPTAPSDSEHWFSLGPMVGGHFSLRPVGFLESMRWLTIYGRLTASYGFGEYGKDAGAQSAETGLELGPFYHLGGFAGWRWWSLDRERSSNDSEVDLGVNGPVVGLLIKL